jgi:hypothetical protein
MMDVNLQVVPVSHSSFVVFMGRLLYEYSVTYRGHLIIPVEYCTIAEETLYSYALLSELGSKGQFHKADNPAGLFATSVEGIIQIAKEHLIDRSDIQRETNHFQNRYLYRNTLIIVQSASGKVFYDHYPPTSLNNIAAPKIFQSESECLHWIKQGFDQK